MDLDAALAGAIERFERRNPKSYEQYQRALAPMPGGNSRSNLYYSPFPLCMVRGHGARLIDADDHDYVDLLAEYTAGLFGHSDPVIRAAINDALDAGVNLAAQNRAEVGLAQILCERFPSLEKVRFTNSGTEANLMALTTAKVFTGRRKILVFQGGYHGAGLTFPTANVTLTNIPHDFVIATYNDIESALEAARAAEGDLAAILVEPMLGAGGCIPGEPAFLQALRDEATRQGAILIFDEVMTSRLGPGGRQALIGITPDMTTLGKYIGGTLTFGAFGGRADLMNQYDPRSPTALQHGGTFNNNTLTMAAGLAAMTKVLTPERSREVNARGDRLRDGLNKLFEETQAPLYMTGLGSVMNIQAKRDAATANKIRDLLFFDLVERGYYIARRGMVVLSLPLTDEDADGFATAMEGIVTERRAVL